MRPEDVPALERYPHVKKFVASHVAMQFGDIRAMLSLPTGQGGDRIEHGCNFAAANALCSIVSGLSVVFFDRQGKVANAKRRYSNRGKRFKRLLKFYYPWTDGEDRVAKIDALYDLTRNPLAHSLGVLESGQVPIAIVKPKDGLTIEQVSVLDGAHDSTWQVERLPPALGMEGGAWQLNVPIFYSAVVELFRRLVCDDTQMEKAEACFARGELTD